METFIYEFTYLDAIYYLEKPMAYLKHIDNSKIPCDFQIANSHVDFDVTPLFCLSIYQTHLMYNNYNQTACICSSIIHQPS